MVTSLRKMVNVSLSMSIVRINVVGVFSVENWQPILSKRACPKRPYVCGYCPFEATFDVVTSQHWLVCGYFPLPCPNGCNAGTVERHHMAENMQNHMRMTQRKLEEQAAEIRERFERDLQGKESEIIELQQANANLQEKQETFGKRFQEKDTEVAQLQQAVTDLQEKFKKDFQEKEEEIVELQRRNANLHEKETAQLQQANVDLQEKMKGVLDQKDCQIAEAQEALKQKDQQLADIAVQLHEKDERIIQLEASLRKAKDKDVTKHGDWLFTMPCYNPSYWQWTATTCFYTHFEGYKLQLQASADSNVMSVELHLRPGDFDYKLKWPLKATVALQLIDPAGRHPPYEMSAQGELVQPSRLCQWKPFITHTGLEKYVYSDSLRFRVVSVKLD